MRHAAFPPLLLTGLIILFGLPMHGHFERDTHGRAAHAHDAHSHVDHASMTVHGHWASPFDIDVDHSATVEFDVQGSAVVKHASSIILPLAILTAWLLAQALWICIARYSPPPAVPLRASPPLMRPASRAPPR